MALPGYAVENQPVVLNGVTEVLVHGVGGESAEDTLYEPHPVQVAGDVTAGFYRGPDGAHPTAPSPTTAAREERMHGHSSGSARSSFSK
jgi:hypothetical protein